MPYINSRTTLKLTEEKKETIKTELGKIMSEVLGKSEEWLMIGFDDSHALYFRGVKKEKAAFIEVEMIGKAERENKNKVTSLICDLYEKELEIPKDSIYITFREVEDWGYNGSLF